jgi:hypothetical protein
MIRHWNRLLRQRDRPGRRRRMIRAPGRSTRSAWDDRRVLVVVLITKFLLGAWIAIAAMAVIYAD